MSDDARWNNDELSLEALERINRVCLQFEAVWKEDREPKIEDYLGATKDEERAALLRELLLLDLDYRWRFQNPATAEDYRARFPNDRELIEGILGRLSTRTMLGAAAVRHPARGQAQSGLPSRLGDYELEEMLGEGGMGTVYRARQSSVSRIVALKVVRPDRFAGLPADRLQDTIRRFQVEIQAAAQLEHESIVPVYEVGQLEGQPFFSMRYFEGGSLDSIIRQGPLGAREAASVVEKIARAVQYAHDKGVIHRDLKPRNILLDSDGHPYIADFGLAKTKEMQEHLTLSGEVVGTPAYMAPEQARGEASVGMAADIYGLGATLYELITGRPPFHAATVAETQRQVVDDDPVPPRELNSAIPRDLETICLKCLEKDPRSRYATADEVAEELARFCQRRPIKARPINRIQRFWRWCRRNPLDAGLSVAVAVSLLVGVLVSGYLAVVARDRAYNLAEAVEEQQRLTGVAEQNAEEASDRLWESYLAQARANRLSRRLGQQSNTLEVIKKAAAIRFSPELRDEAIACMAMPDLEFERQLPPGVHHRLHPDFASYADDDGEGNVCLRRVSDDQILARFVKSGRVGDPFFSSDGRLLAQCYEVNGNLRICFWDLEGGKVVLTLSLPATAEKMRLSPDSQYFSVVSEKSTLRLYHLDDGALLNTIDLGGPPTATFFAPKSRHLAVTFGKTTIHHYRPSDGELLATIRTPSSVRRRSYNANGTRLAIVCVRDQDVVRIYDTDVGSIVQELKFDIAMWAGPVWHPGGKVLAVPSGSLIHLWDSETGEQDVVFRGHRHTIISLDFNSTGDLLATSGWDYMLRIWDPVSGATLLQTPGRYASFSRDDQRLLMITGDVGDVWRVAPRHLRMVRPLSPNASGKMPFALDGRELIGRTAFGPVSWDLTKPRHIVHLPVQAGKWWPQGHGLVTKGRTGLQCWPMSIDQKKRTLTLGPPITIGRHQNGLFGFNSLGTTLVSQSRDQGDTIMVRHLNRPGEVTYLRPHKRANGIAIRHDGRWVATATKYGRGLKVWDTTSGALVATLYPDRKETKGVFSPDGKWLFTDGRYHDGEFRRIGQWDEPIEVAYHWGVAFSPDNHVYAARPNRTTLQLFDVSSRNPLARLEAPEPFSQWARFSPDGTRLMSSCANGTREIWDLRAIRRRLRTLGLDWDSPPLPPPVVQELEKPLAIDVREEEVPPSDWPAFQHYRKGDWKAARKATEESMRQTFGGNGYHWFLMAKIHVQLGDLDEARRWFHCGCRWTEREMPNDEDLRNLRFEAATAILEAESRNDRPPLRAEDQGLPVLKRLPTTEWIDLLDDTDPAIDAVVGKWQRQSDGLRVERRRRARVMLPIQVAGDYEMEIQVTRTEGVESISVLLPIGGRQCDLMVGGWPTGNVNGLEGIAEKQVIRNSSCVRSAAFQTGKRHTIRVRVQTRGNIAAIESWLDDQSLVRWAGDSNSLRSFWWDLPELTRPGVGAYNVKATFHAVRLRPLSGKGALLPDNRLAIRYVLTANCPAKGSAHFREIIPQGGRLVGFALCVTETVTSAQTVYRTPVGEVTGLPRGSGEANQRVIARPGYAISGLILRGDKQVNGMRVIFARVNGNELDPDDSYESEWFGSETGKEQRVSSDGDPIVGIHGIGDRSLDSLGLVIATMPESTVDRSAAAPIPVRSSKRDSSK